MNDNNCGHADSDVHEVRDGAWRIQKGLPLTGESSNSAVQQYGGVPHASQSTFSRPSAEISLSVSEMGEEGWDDVLDWVKVEDIRGIDSGSASGGGGGADGGLGGRGGTGKDGGSTGAVDAYLCWVLGRNVLAGP
jgi:hypothetical protein